MDFEYIENELDNLPDKPAQQVADFLDDYYVRNEDIIPLSKTVEALYENGLRDIELEREAQDNIKLVVDTGELYDSEFSGGGLYEGRFWDVKQHLFREEAKLESEEPGYRLNLSFTDTWRGEKITSQGRRKLETTDTYIQVYFQ